MFPPPNAVLVSFLQISVTASHLTLYILDGLVGLQWLFKAKLSNTVCDPLVAKRQKLFLPGFLYTLTRNVCPYSTLWCSWPQLRWEGCWLCTYMQLFIFLWHLASQDQIYREEQTSAKHSRKMDIIAGRTHFLLALSHLWDNMVLGLSPSDSPGFAKRNWALALPEVRITDVLK